MTPAGAQTITTSGHTQDDSFHLNGGDGSATWAVHYEVSKTSTSTLSGQEGPFTSQAEADVAAEAAKNAAINQLKNEAQGMVDAAIASARAQLANITFSYDEITIPHGFDTTPGALGSHQTITVPANSSNDYQMQNDESRCSHSPLAGVCTAPVPRISRGRHRHCWCSNSGHTVPAYRPPRRSDCSARRFCLC